MTVELLPVKANCRPGEPVLVELRGVTEAGTLRVSHLGDPVAEHAVGGSGIVDLGELPAGGYGIELRAGATVARTAIEVFGRRPRLRYGFVTDYRPGRDLGGVADNVRRLHLTDIQCYDWAYRHADLLGGGETYTDALDQPIALDTVRTLIRTLDQIGVRALGYAAVYGVGNAEWPKWAQAALLRPSGEPYSLGDFLRLVDPADPDWLAHFTEELRAAVDCVGFAGFHLDQYGYPKYATRPDGARVLVAESFVKVIEAARAALPASRLVFNNVNDFPTWRTGKTAQDAVYVEVWPPHTTLGHLAAVVNRAKVAGNGKPVVIAAYHHVYDSAPAVIADLATAFTMATLFSHGATHLLCGEADRILVDPYYVRNHVVEDSTSALLHRWYDFLVEHVELLDDPALAEVTGAVAGDYNGDCDISYGTIPVTETATQGAVWRRVLGTDNRLVLHLINLTGQTDTEWDAPRAPVAELPPGRLRIRRCGNELPRVRCADPDRQASLTEVEVRADGDDAIAVLPALYIWQLLVIDL